jgi:predicted transcriptional regulator
MMARMMAALVRRATAGDLFALEALANIRAGVSYSLAAAARGAHDGPARYSWTEIAAELGISRQAARQLYGGQLEGDD